MADEGPVELALSVDVARCAGLLAAVQDALQLYQDSAAALGSAHLLGPHPYVTVSLLPDHLAAQTDAPTVQTPFQAQTFCPTYNFKESVVLPASPAVLRAIVAEEMRVEVWHHCPRSQGLVNALSEGRAATGGSTGLRNVFLGTARTPLMHLLTKPQGVGGWLVLRSQRGQAAGAVQITVRVTSLDGRPVPAGVPPIHACPKLLDWLEPKVQVMLSAACIGHGFDGQWGQCSVHVEEAMLPVYRHGRDKRPPGGPHFVAYKLPGNSGEERTSSSFPCSSPTHPPLAPGNTWHVKWDHCGRHPVRVDQELAESLLCYPLVIAVFRRDTARAKKQTTGTGNSVLIGRAEVDLSPLLLNRNVGGSTPQRWLSGTYPLVNPSAKHLGNARLRIRILLDLHKSTSSRLNSVRSPVDGCAWKPRRMAGKRSGSVSPEPTMAGKRSGSVSPDPRMAGRSSVSPSPEPSPDAVHRSPARHLAAKITGAVIPEPCPHGASLSPYSHSWDGKINASPSTESSLDDARVSPRSNLGRRRSRNGIDALGRGLASTPSEKRVLALNWRSQQERGQEHGQDSRESMEQCALPSSDGKESRISDPVSKQNLNSKSFAARVAALRGQKVPQDGGTASLPLSGKTLGKSRSLGATGDLDSAQGGSVQEMGKVPLKPKPLKHGTKGGGIGEHIASADMVNGKNVREVLQQLREPTKDPVAIPKKKSVGGSTTGQLSKKPAGEPLRTCSDDENFIVIGGVSASDSDSSLDIPVGVFTGAESDSEDKQLGEGKKLQAGSLVLPSVQPFEYDEDWMFSISASGSSLPAYMPLHDNENSPEADTCISSSGNAASTTPEATESLPTPPVPSRQPSAQSLLRAAASRVAPASLRSGQIFPRWPSSNSGVGPDEKVGLGASLRDSDDVPWVEHSGNSGSSGGGLEATVSAWRSLEPVCGSPGSLSSGSSLRSDTDGGANGRDSEKRQCNNVGSRATQGTTNLAKSKVIEGCAGSEDAYDVGSTGQAKRLAGEGATRNQLESGGIQPEQESKMGNQTGDSGAASGQGKDTESDAFANGFLQRSRISSDEPANMPVKGKHVLDKSVDSSEQAGKQSAESSLSAKAVAVEATGSTSMELEGKNDVWVDDEIGVRIERVAHQPTADGKCGAGAKVNFVNKLPPPPDDTPIEYAAGGGRPSTYSANGTSLTPSQAASSPDGPSTTKPFAQKHERASRSKPPLPTHSALSSHAKNGESLNSMDSDASLFSTTLGSGASSVAPAASPPGEQLWSSRASDAASEAASEASAALVAVSVPLLGLNFYQSPNPPGVLEPIVPLPTPVSIGLLANSPLQALSTGSLGLPSPTLDSSSQMSQPLASTQAMPGIGLSQISGSLGSDLSGGLPKLASQSSAAASILQHLRVTSTVQRLNSSEIAPVAGCLCNKTDAHPMSGTGSVRQQGPLGVQLGAMPQHQGSLMGAVPGALLGTLSGGAPFQGGDRVNGEAGSNGLQGTAYGQQGGLAFSRLNAQLDLGSGAPSLGAALGTGLPSSGPACCVSSALPGAAHSTKVGNMDGQEFQFPTAAAIHCSQPPVQGWSSRFSLPPSPLTNRHVPSRDAESSQQSALGSWWTGQTGQGTRRGSCGTPRQPGWWRSLMSEKEEEASVLAGLFRGKTLDGSDLFQSGGQSQGDGKASETTEQAAAAGGSTPPPSRTAQTGGRLGTKAAGVAERPRSRKAQTSDDAEASTDCPPEALAIASAGTSAVQVGMVPTAVRTPETGHAAGGGIFVDADDRGAGRGREGPTGAGAGRRKYADEETARIAKIMSSKFGGS
ncbi:unnamed protein product [Ostreobium quekettii]|uniref:C2 domain-containing protein n=1 Tax=Ostreobium quekettii TaxID=121088 RepID=A0A8S1ITL7_9CHLO|nr:unnamed protein product [Ostreobium quekettii]